jgi:hypothetical protein
MDKAKIYCLLGLLLFTGSLLGQQKRAANWIMGGSSSGNGLKLDFNEVPVSVTYEHTGLWMFGSNTSMSDEEGRLLFASNGCFIVNAEGAVMMNGDSINPGLMQRIYCYEGGGGSPLRQGVVAVPKPREAGLYYVFNFDLDYAYLGIPDVTAIAPLRLYYHIVDMELDEGLGAVVEKHQIALQDTFALGNIQAVRHANNRDWWIVVPKSLSNCYYMLPLTSEGLQPAQLKCAGLAWGHEDDGQAVFSPDLKKYARFNAWNGLNIFDFDNEAGELSNPVHIEFPAEEIGAVTGVAISPSSRFLYACAFTKVYQFDLEAEDIAASQVLVAEWDGTYNPAATIFYMAALAPDGKIYISSTSSTFNLHVIEQPDKPGLACQLVQRGLELPGFNAVTVPNIPHYCSEAEPGCGTPTGSAESALGGQAVALYPNPTAGELWVNAPGLSGRPYRLRLYSLQGKEVLSARSQQPLSHFDLSHLPPGTYVYLLESGSERASGKIVKGR